VDVRVRGLAVRHPKLASDVVRGLDFGVGARGLLTDQGELRLDDAELEMGALRLRTHGALQQAPDHLLASVVVDVPTAPCQMLLDSVPSALIPTVKGARMNGTFGAHGRIGFDTRKVDDLVLEYVVADQCKMTEVPEELARERFTRPFMHRVYLPDGTIEEEQMGPGSASWTDLDHISPYMQVAVLTTEDGAFPHHHGFNHAAIRNSLVANLKTRKFLRGASTITMQLAKNLFLFREKTLARKLEEVILTDYLEQVFGKDDLMELYLNVIEFGPDIYGVTAAAEHYFGRKPGELNLAECLFLSSIMPSPLKNHKIYEKGEVPEAWMRHVRALMSIAEKTGKISKTELAEGLAEPIVFHKSDAPPPAPRPSLSVPRFRDDDSSWVAY
jgi:membrane peptidoglycan carboxypeptidase